MVLDACGDANAGGADSACSLGQKLVSYLKQAAQTARTLGKGETSPSGCPAPVKFEFKQPLRSQCNRRSRKIVIFDWDDTLLCTSFLIALGEGEIPPPRVAACLRDAAVSARELLLQSLLVGPTFIVTNATVDWVQNSARVHLPELLPVLESVSIISARSEHEAHYPDVGQWKVQAFLSLAQHVEFERVTDLIVVGDSELEMDAAAALHASTPHRFHVKTVRLHAHPAPEDLAGQLRLLVRRFGSIVRVDGSVDINLQRPPCDPRALCQATGKF